MLEWLRWYLVLSSVCLSGMAFAQNNVHFDNGYYFVGNLYQPEQVMEYLKHAPKERKKMAEKLYASAVRDTQRLKTGASWGSVAKASFESATSYPTGKALLLGTEGRLKNWAEAKSRPEPPVIDVGNKPIEYAVRSLDSAIAVENHERSMPDEQRAKLVPYRDCLKRYLGTGKAEPDCIPLQWAGITAPGADY